MTEDQIKHMTNRFLQWRLPSDFNPDNGISAARPNYAPNVAWEPVGTNLLTYTQAEEMVRFILERGPAVHEEEMREALEAAMPFVRDASFKPNAYGSEACDVWYKMRACLAPAQPAPDAPVERSRTRTNDGTRAELAANICDCELSHNGIGMMGRECDCPAGEREP